MKITPLHLDILLHYHVSPEQHPQFDAPAVTKYTEDLIEMGVLEQDETTLMYGTTPLGAAWIRSILKTPLPVQCWVDPRNGASV